MCSAAHVTPRRVSATENGAGAPRASHASRSGTSARPSTLSLVASGGSRSGHDGHNFHHGPCVGGARFRRAHRHRFFLFIACPLVRARLTRRNIACPHVYTAGPQARRWAGHVVSHKRSHAPSPYRDRRRRRRRASAAARPCARAARTAVATAPPRRATLAAGGAAGGRDRTNKPFYADRPPRQCRDRASASKQHQHQHQSVARDTKPHTRVEERHRKKHPRRATRRACIVSAPSA